MRGGDREGDRWESGRENYALQRRLFYICISKILLGFDVYPLSASTHKCFGCFEGFSPRPICICVHKLLSLLLMFLFFC